MVVALFVVFCSQAQIGGGAPPTTDYNNIKMAKSPNAASFATFGSTPVNNATGVPNINIPLYTLEVDGVSIPISISYNASGVRVADLASTVGMNWSLNAGGLFSRTVRSLPDENYGWLDHNHTFLDDDWYDQYNPQHPDDWQEAMVGYPPFFNTSYAKTRDHNPDWFSYSFLGNSGHFILDPELNLIREKVDGLDIIYEGNTDSNIQVKDLNGNQYYFNITEKGNNLNRYISGEGIDNFSFQGDDPSYRPITAWMISKITTKNNKTINFSYTSIDMAYVFNEVESNISLIQSCGQYSGFGVGKGKTNIEYSYNSQLLNKIWTDDGQMEILFTYSTDENLSHWKTKLTKITIHDLLKNSKKEFHFVHDKYGGDPRLRLKELYESGYNKYGNSNRKPSYIFNYYSDQLPSKTSFAQDFYGFYNGKTQNKSLVPRYNSSYSFFSSVNFGQFYMDNTGDRSFNNNVKAGILTDIIYPTGASTYFTYEPNEINGKYLGGLRIKNIEDVDDTGIFNKKTYTYENLVGENPLSNDYVTSKEKGSSTTYYSNTVAVPGELNRGYTPEYFYGKVSVTSHNDTEQIKQEYLYEMNPYSLHKYDYVLASENYFKGSHIVKTIEYNNSIVSDTGTPEYFKWNVLGTMTCYTAENNKAKLGYGLGSKVEFQGNYAYLPKQVATTEFLGTGLKAVTTIKEIEYDPNTLLKIKEIVDTRKTRKVNSNDVVSYEITDPNGERLTTNYEYPWSNGINLPNLPQGLLISKKISSLEANEQIFGQYFKYDSFGNIKTTFQFNKGEGSNNAGYYIPNNYEEMTSFLFSHGKPVQTLDKYGSPTSYIWGYGGQYPVAKIEGLSYSVISTNGHVSAIQNVFQTLPFNENNLVTALTNLRTSYPEAMVTTYTYKPLSGVETITDPKGDVQYFEYDAFGRLLKVKDKQGKILSENEYNYAQ